MKCTKIFFLNCIYKKYLLSIKFALLFCKSSVLNSHPPLLDASLNLTISEGIEHKVARILYAQFIEELCMFGCINNSTQSKPNTLTRSSQNLKKNINNVLHNHINVYTLNII